MILGLKGLKETKSTSDSRVVGRLCTSKNKSTKTIHKRVGMTVASDNTSRTKMKTIGTEYNRYIEVCKTKKMRCIEGDVFLG